jgi:hypothetical protein
LARLCVSFSAHLFGRAGFRGAGASPGKAILLLRRGLGAAEAGRLGEAGVAWSSWTVKLSCGGGSAASSLRPERLDDVLNFVFRSALVTGDVSLCRAAACCCLQGGIFVPQEDACNANIETDGRRIWIAHVVRRAWRISMMPVEAGVVDRDGRMLAMIVQLWRNHVIH